jgi:restriction endonuclease S subunit
MKYLWPRFKNYEGQSTTLSILNKSQFSKIEIVDRSREEENTIAGFLNSLDSKIENNCQVNKNLVA